jgi:hypothetical protein
MQHIWQALLSFHRWMSGSSPAWATLAGMTVCVLDVGGGTADITVHDVEERGGRTVLAEALHAVGALAGSAYVDTAFRCVGAWQHW